MNSYHDQRNMHLNVEFYLTSYALVVLAPRETYAQHVQT
jgi:hypothetical protein